MAFFGRALSVPINPLLLSEEEEEEEEEEGDEWVTPSEPDLEEREDGRP